MLSDAIRRRLALVNRGPIESATACDAAPSGAAQSDGASSRANEADRSSIAPADSRRQLALFYLGDRGPAGDLSQVVEHRTEAGTHLRWQRPLAALAPRSSLEPPGIPTRGQAPAPGAPHPELIGLAAHRPHAALYLDLETCGFAGSMIFLVGLIRQVDDQLWLDQLLARDYAQERAVLATLWQIIAKQRVLVTFNGKSFDWPMVKDRSTLHRLGGGGARPSAGSAPRLLHDDLLHCDLLHHARRRWRDQLPDCRLQTLERWICGRHRSGDVPGALVPRVYHEYVRSGDLRRIEPVLHHNAIDLLTLVQISQALLGPGSVTAESA